MHFLSCRSLWSLANYKMYPLAVTQRMSNRIHHPIGVYEYVFASVIALDKAILFPSVEPINCSRFFF
jgi:hypothetical protein